MTKMKIKTLNILFAFIWIAIVYIDKSDSYNVAISIDTTKIIQKTDDKFIGVAIDSGVIREHWSTFDLSSKKIQTLAKALSPCYIRVGGTDADFLIFDDGKSRSAKTGKVKVKHVPIPTKFGGTKSDTLKWKPHQKPYDKLLRDVKFPKYVEDNKSKPHARSRRDIGLYYDNVDKHFTNYTMSAEFYDQLHAWVSTVGWDLIFDLNVLLRTDGHWNPTNAISLMKYTVEKGYKMAGWELGNEPNAYYHNFHIRIHPELLASDYLTLHTHLTSFTQFDNGVVMGPSVTQLDKTRTDNYYKSFLTSGGGDVVNAASFHQYYVDAKVATLDQFYDPAVLNILLGELKLGTEIVKQSGTKARVWMGETSSAWGGGAEGLSDTYIAAFMWLDKLGLAAVYGVQALIRQSFFGGHYALIDHDTFDPRPDYWLTLLYNTLVGSRVLSVISPSHNGTVRAYAHCVNSNSSSHYSLGSVVVFVMNINDDDNVTVTLSDFGADQTLHVYSMTPLDGDLQASTVLLNDLPLQMKSDTELPNLLRPIKTRGPINIPAVTYAFIVIPDADIDVCK